MPLIPEWDQEEYGGAENPLRLINLYFDANNSRQWWNSVDFITTVDKALPFIRWRRPNAKNPWHIRGRMETNSGYVFYVDVWPHKGKWNIDAQDGRPREGWVPLIEAVHSLLDEHSGV
jgi:hypothetical protein